MNDKYTVGKAKAYIGNTEKGLITKHPQHQHIEISLRQTTDRFGCEVEPGDLVLYVADNTYLDRLPDLDLGVVRMTLSTSILLITSYALRNHHQLCRVKDVVVMTEESLPEKYREPHRIQSIMESGSAY